MSAIEDEEAESGGEEDPDGVFDKDELVAEEGDVDGGELSETAHAAEFSMSGCACKSQSEPR